METSVADTSREAPVVPLTPRQAGFRMAVRAILIATFDVVAMVRFIPWVLVAEVLPLVVLTPLVLPMWLYDGDAPITRRAWHAFLRRWLRSVVERAGRS